MTAALRYNAGKAELSYLLSIPDALTALCKVFAQGAVKYERDNWARGGKPDTEYLDAALRHLYAAQYEDHDPDTGCSHVAHAVWNLCVLIELNGKGPTFDPAFDQVAFTDRYAHRPAAV